MSTVATRCVLPCGSTCTRHASAHASLASLRVRDARLQRLGIEPVPVVVVLLPYAIAAVAQRVRRSNARQRPAQRAAAAHRRICSCSAFSSGTCAHSATRSSTWRMMSVSPRARNVPKLVRMSSSFSPPVSGSTTFAAQGRLSAARRRCTGVGDTHHGALHARPSNALDVLALLGRHKAVIKERAAGGTGGRRSVASLACAAAETSHRGSHAMGSIQRSGVATCVPRSCSPSQPGRRSASAPAPASSAVAAAAANATASAV